MLHGFTDINHNLNIGVEFSIDSKYGTTVTPGNWSVRVLYIGI